MRALDELLEECERLHGHLCPGQVLGARMALLGCRLLGLSEPRELVARIRHRGSAEALIS